MHRRAFLSTLLAGLGAVPLLSALGPEARADAGPTPEAITPEWFEETWISVRITAVHDDGTATAEWLSL